MNSMGLHATADMWLAQYPGDAAVADACSAALAVSGMRVVAFAGKEFDPHGMTRVWLLEESHFSVHTYPEHAYISVDCYTCGAEGAPDAVIDALITRLLPERVQRATITRGVPCRTVQ